MAKRRRTLTQEKILTALNNLANADPDYEWTDDEANRAAELNQLLPYEAELENAMSIEVEGEHAGCATEIASLAAANKQLKLQLGELREASTKAANATVREHSRLCDKVESLRFALKDCLIDLVD